jgi:hypothetical protein
MKWIVYQSLNSDVELLNHSNSVKIAYLLNLKVVPVGIDESIYFISNYAEKLPLSEKIERLLASNADNLKNYEAFANAKQSLKDFTKLKNKSSKHIVAINIIKKTITTSFTELMKHSFEVGAGAIHLPILKELVDHKKFYFYTDKNSGLLDVNVNSEFVINMLQLDLPDPENGNPMFFLSNFKKEGIKMDIDFLHANDKKAEDKNNFYGEESYIFPLMNSLSSKELISTRKELEKTTLEFREKIDEWATICYANPNTNLGLDYFRKNLQPYLKSTKNDVLENPFLKNVSSMTNKNLETQIIIGEAPIEKIWELFLISKTIKQEVYNNLMKIKTEQYPKFEGRWPIVFFKPTDDAENYMNDEAQNDGVKSVRKSISLD